MISSIPQIDMSVQTLQPSDKPQPQDVKQADGFGSMLRKAQKAKDQADQSDASGKTEDVGGSAGKTEKDGEKLSGNAASAASQEVPRQIPASIRPDVPAAQAAAQAPVLSAVPEDNAQAAPEADTRAMQILTPKAVPQIPENRTGTAVQGNPLPAEANAVSQTGGPVQPAESKPSAAIEGTTSKSPQAEIETSAALQDADFYTPADKAVSILPTAVSERPEENTVSQTPAQPDAVKSFASPAQTVRKGSASEEEAKLQTLRQTSQRSADAPQKTSLFSGIYSGFSGGKVIVKVSDAASQAVPTVGSQLCSAVSDGMKAGKRQLQVDLYPQSLGKVSVSLASENGVLTVEIAASNPKTQSLLASSSGEISSMLRASTGQAVQVTTGQQAQQQFAGQNGGSAQQEAARQQQQQEEARKYRAAQWYAAENSAGFSTKDFLTALKSAAV